MGICSTEYLELLSKDYPTIQSVATEIINLQAILNLPKGTEHFMSDLHGEYEAFLHVLKSASGVIRTKIDELYSNTVSEKDRKILEVLIYYPKQKLYFLEKKGVTTKEWYKLTLYRLVDLCRISASKYTRSKVRKAMPKDFAYILEELLQPCESDNNRHDYYAQIINSIIDIGRADAFIVALSNLIQRLTIDHLHIIGDVFDRGPRADIIMDHLINYHSIDLQWGNHDIVWIGAAAGHPACIANVIRNSLRYNNFDVIEIGYGINTRPLANFALETYGLDKCKRFIPLDHNRHAINSHDALFAAKMHKAITVIQFKLEGRIISNHPEYNMEERDLFSHMDIGAGTVMRGKNKYNLTDSYLPTVDPQNPLALTSGEQEVIDGLCRSFLHSEKLQEHIRFMVSRGSMYKIYNGNLLFHGCIPLNESGLFDTVNFFGTEMSGKEYLDRADKYVREAYYSSGREREELDFLWYLWCGSKSPLFGKDISATFETYFTDDDSLKEETKNHYYRHIDKEQTCNMIIEEFGLDKNTAHIINGHVPVRTKNGESPVKANGKLFVIDGGFSKQYRETTGIAGYTLINNSYGFTITQHQPFTSISDIIENDCETHSSKVIVERNFVRRKVRDTDTGKKISRRISILTELLDAYRTGILQEKVK